MDEERRREARRADDQGGGINWQAVANIVVSLLLAIGAYVWSENAKQVHDLQAVSFAQMQQIARLEERRDAQERLIGELQGQLRRMEDKLDKALDEQREQRRSGGLTGRMFDK